MNIVFLAFVAIAFAVAAWRQLTAPVSDAGALAPMQALSEAMLTSAGGAVELAIKLIGVMALFLGLMKVAEAGGLLVVITRLVRPLMVRLFPDVPADHPAMGAIILNMSANVLGLANAATPFGIRAMQELDRLNPVKGTASNAMATFLAINTSSVTLLPTGIIGLRVAAGSADPAAIVPTTLFATVCSTTVAIIAVRLLQRFWPVTAPPPEPSGTAGPAAGDDGPVTADPPDPVLPDTTAGAYPLWVSLTVLAVVLALVPGAVVFGSHVSPWIIPSLMILLLGFGAVRGVRAYEVFVEGAKEGFQVAVRIIPYLVAILVAVAMLRASGAMAMILTPLGTVTEPLGLPADALPMALLRPLSGSGAYGLVAEILNNPAIGPDSYTGILVSTLQGSTETTFYVLAVYFGAVGIRRVRHALAAALCADLAGVAGAVFICSLLYGP